MNIRSKILRAGCALAISSTILLAACSKEDRAATTDSAKKHAQELKDKTAEVAADAKAGASNAMASAKDKAAGAKDATKEAAASAKDKTANATASAKDKSSEMMAAAKDKTAGAMASAKDTAASAQDKTADALASAKDKSAEMLATAKDKANDLMAKAKDGTAGATAGAKDKAADALAGTSGSNASDAAAGIAAAAGGAAGLNLAGAKDKAAAEAAKMKAAGSNALKSDDIVAKMKAVDADSSLGGYAAQVGVLKTGAAALKKIIDANSAVLPAGIASKYKELEAMVPQISSLTDSLKGAEGAELASGQTQLQDKMGAAKKLYGEIRNMIPEQYKTMIPAL